jgi:hypothetical protein
MPHDATLWFINNPKDYPVNVLRDRGTVQKNGG